MLLDWEKGLPVLGLKSNPVPWAYVAADRTERTAHRTLEDMGLSPSQIPLIPAFGRHHKNRRQIIEALAKRGAQFAVIEGFQKFVDAPGLGHQVTNFLEELSTYTDPSPDFPQGLTILGVVESPKLKPNERYTDARQRVSGVSAWGYYSATVFLIERKTPQDASDPRRTLFVCPKHGKRLEVPGSFDKEGHLIFTPEPADKPAFSLSVVPKLG